MELQTNDGNHANRKRKLRVFAGILIVLLIICTLFSNTLYAITLPKVTVLPAAPGQLELAFQSGAVIKPVEVRDLAGQAGWTVTKVLVKAGDAVKLGQTLVQYDNVEARQQLEKEQVMLDKLQLSVEKLMYDYIQSEHNEDTGVVLAAKAALENTKLDINMQKQHILDLQTKLSSNQTLKAPFDGTIAAANAKEGLSANAGSPDIKLINTKMGYQLELQIPTEVADALTIGETTEVRLPGQNSRTVEGEVAGLEQDVSDGRKTVRMTILLQDQSLANGERAEVNIRKKGKDGALIISNAAIRKDQSGTYVYVIEERKGPLGNAFYASRRDVAVVNANEHAAAIGSGLFQQESVIVESNEPLLEGSRVRILAK